VAHTQLPAFFWFTLTKKWVSDEEMGPEEILDLCEALYVTGETETAHRQHNGDN